MDKRRGGGGRTRAKRGREEQGTILESEGASREKRRKRSRIDKGERGEDKTLKLSFFSKE